MVSPKNEQCKYAFVDQKSKNAVSETGPSLTPKQKNSLVRLGPHHTTVFRGSWIPMGYLAPGLRKCLFAAPNFLPPSNAEQIKDSCRNPQLNLPECSKIVSCYFAVLQQAIQIKLALYATTKAKTFCSVCACLL